MTTKNVWNVNVIDLSLKGEVVLKYNSCMYYNPKFSFTYRVSYTIYVSYKPTFQIITNTFFTEVWNSGLEHHLHFLIQSNIVACPTISWEMISNSIILYHSHSHNSYTLTKTVLEIPSFCLWFILRTKPIICIGLDQMIL